MCPTFRALPLDLIISTNQRPPFGKWAGLHGSVSCQSFSSCRLIVWGGHAAVCPILHYSYGIIPDGAGPAIRGHPASHPGMCERGLKLSFYSNVALGEQRPIVVKLSRERSVGLSVGACVRASVCLSSALSKNDLSAPDAVWHHRSDVPEDEAGGGVWRSVHWKGYFWANLGRAIVSNGKFTTYVCDSASTVGAAV